jgi:hypothetical protein
VNNKALLPHRDTKSTMTLSTFIAPQLYISGAREWLPQVSKSGIGTHFVLRYVSSASTGRRASVSGGYVTLPRP